jgi:asparagine synthase (glutamine-hydrolysing)
MSAIAVVLDLRGDAITERTFDRVFRAVDDRGPQGLASWHAGQVALARQLLAITPEDEFDRQPIVLGDTVTVFDGRIDNREELITELGLEEPVTTITDPELVAHAWRRWSEQTPSRLLGDFTFAIWDQKHESLYCARDALGIRPLYYWTNGRTLVVATDIRSILAHSGFSIEPNLHHVVDTLLWELNDRTGTLYEGALRLEPAHAMTVAGGRVAIERYWDVDLDQEITYARDEEYVEHFLDVFTSAVRARLRVRDDPHTSLSGGLDSSLVTALAARELSSMGDSQREVVATSLTYDGLDCDERDWIREATTNTAARSRLIPWTPWGWDELQAEARTVAYLPPYPNALFDMFVRGGISHRAVLTGIGGDQWMRGRDAYFRDLRRARRWAELTTKVASGSVAPFWRVTKEYIDVLTQRGQDTPSNTAPCWFGPALPLPRTTPPALAEPPRGAQLARAERYEIMHNPYEAYVFELSDRCASRGDLQVLHPFYDRRVVEFAFSLPDSQHWHGRDRRWLERRAMSGIVTPAIVRRRSEAEFTATYARQVAQLPLREVVRRGQLARLGWLHPDLEVTTSGLRSSGMELPVYAVWGAVALDAWANAVLA